MGQDGSSFYLDSLNTSGKPLSCEIKAGDILIQRSNCDDQYFTYNGSSDISVFVQLDNDQGTWIYNPSSRIFTSAYRGTTDVTNNNGNNSSSSSNTITISSSNNNPGLGQYVGLTIRVYDSYGNLDTSFQDDVRFTVSKMDSYGSYYTANSSDYYLNNTRYTFSSSDDGYVYLSNYLQFNTSGTYKVRAENTRNGAIADTTFYVNTSCTSSCWNSSSSISNIGLETSSTNPSTNQYLSTYTTLRDYNNNRVYNYAGTIRYVVEKRDSSNYNWYSASSSDYYLSPTSTYFSTSDQWYKTISSQVVFYNNWYYRIKAYDDSNSNVYGYREVTVGYGSSNNSNRTVSLDTSSTNPSTNQYISTYTTVKDTYGSRDYNYVGTMRYVVEKRDSSNYNWYSASSSDYYLSTTSSYFSSNDQWYKTISSHVVFYNNGYYRIRVYDDNNSTISTYSYVTVGNGNNWSNSSYNRFDLSSNTTTPGRDNFVSLSITAKDQNGYTLSSYNNRVRFYVYRRIYTSDSWSDITSSSTDNSAYRIYDTSYSFPSYNNGYVTLTNFIKFYSDSYDYKVRVVDDSNSNVYGEIIYYLRNSNSSSNWSSSSTAYRFAGTLTPTVPELYSSFWVRIYVKDSSNRTITNYTRTIRLSLERKSLASSTTWSSVSSSYCRLDRTSYSFSSSDNGYVNLNDMIKCSKKGFYRLKITDYNDSSVYGYIYFTIVDTDDFVNSLGWFTSYQRETVQELYRTFMSSINEWELNSNTLSRSSSWATTWRNYYTKLNALAYNKSGRLSSYSRFLDVKADFDNEYNRLR